MVFILCIYLFIGHNSSCLIFSLTYHTYKIYATSWLAQWWWNQELFSGGSWALYKGTIPCFSCKIFFPLLLFEFLHVINILFLGGYAVQLGCLFIYLFLKLWLIVCSQKLYFSVKKRELYLFIPKLWDIIR